MNLKKINIISLAVILIAGFAFAFDSDNPEMEYVEPQLFPIIEGFSLEHLRDIPDITGEIPPAEVEEGSPLLWLEVQHANFIEIIVLEPEQPGEDFFQEPSSLRVSEKESEIWVCPRGSRVIDI